ncbi:glycosyltransferase family 2 protein [Halosimplex amylolyticum]|uniref:glycosyltransferase family 2 protein n=1 Tax=Halosimplex amylolyticum TaxID=3396616 RepID=UPI003F57C6F3
MYRDATVGVVIPVYNEAPFVGKVIDTLPRFVDVAYVVDDCSTDDTWQVIQRRESAVQSETPTRYSDGGRSRPIITAIRHETNQGRGGAIKTGYRAALTDGLDVIAVMDGDGQMDPDRLDDLLEPIVNNGADYAKGNRLKVPEHRAEMSPWRLFGNQLLSTLTRIASGYWGTTDSQNGYTAISATILEQLDLGALYDGYGFLNDILVRLNVHDAQIVDVSMPAIYGREESKIEYRTFVPTLSLLLVKLLVWRLTTKYVIGQLHPVAVLYGFGASFGMFGLGFLAHELSQSVSRSTRMRLAVLIFGMTTVILLLAIAIDRLDNLHLVTDGDSP